MNYLAIATVTAALKNILQTGINNDLPGTKVTTVRPDTLNTGVKERKINIFLYHATPSKELQTLDLNTRRPKDGITQKHAIAFDLHYLFTFYGKESNWETQKLLGLTVKTLVDYSKLSSEIIQNTIERDDSLRDSTLANQIQAIKFVPNTMTPEELSRIWSVLFQSPYSLSLAYQAKAVVIQGERIGKSALPVRSTSIYLASALPTINEIQVERVSQDLGKAITLESSLIIYGEKLQSNDTKVKIGNAKITPQQVEDRQIKLDLSTVLKSEINSLRAGVQSLQVIQNLNSNNESVQTIESKGLPFVLCPNIVGNIVVSEVKENWQNLYSAYITVEVDFKVGKRQRVFLLLNQVSNEQPEEAYVFSAKKLEDDLNSIAFSVRNVKAGQYLVRVQIDGAESQLKIDTNPHSFTYNEYHEPKISIPYQESSELNGRSSALNANSLPKRQF